MAFPDEIADAIRKAMPVDAEIQVANSSSGPGFDVSVSWMLNDDPERPNKPSRIISIHVSREASQDFASASTHSQADAYRRVTSFLSQRLANFDPKHNVPRHESPPVERWVIDSNLLFG